MSQRRPSRPDLLSELVGSSWGAEATARAIPRAAPSEPRPALRAKGVPRKLNPTRARARLLGAVALDNACRRRGVSSAKLAEDLGVPKASDKEGDEARAGGLLVSAGEQVLLPEDDNVAIEPIIELLHHRLARKPMGSVDADRLVRVALKLIEARDILNEPTPAVR